MVTTTVAETDLHRVLSSSVGWGTCDCNRLGVMISDSVICVVYVIYICDNAWIWHLPFREFCVQTCNTSNYLSDYNDIVARCYQLPQDIQGITE